MSADHDSQQARAAASEWADILRRGARVASAMMAGASDRVAIGTTPKQTVWRDGKITLSRYEPLADSAPLGPMLILQGLFGRQTVTDLEPDRSLVRRLLAAGTDLWVIDWGNPSRADCCLDFADYALFSLGDALDQVIAETGRPVALMGICQGGVFALCQAALCPERVSGLALAVTPVDFHADLAGPEAQPGLLNTWARNLPPATIEAFLAEHGLVPGALTGALFQSLMPTRNAAKYGSDLLGIADDPAALATFLRMEAWLSDRPDHPAAAARQWLIELYQENRLVRGRFQLDGRRVALSAITCPILNIVAEQDHIVPPPCARALAGHTNSDDYRCLDVPTGHIGVFVSAKAQAIVAPAIADWLAAAVGDAAHGASLFGK
ncbi:MAG: alpha/beta fold hydrolase [Pseudomonadota bacterium]